MTKFWSNMVKRAEPYVPGLQVNEPDILKLNTNENPYPPSKYAICAIQSAAEEKLQLYPTPTADDLRTKIGSLYNLTKDQVFIGNGSDEVLAFAFMAFFEPGKTIRYPDITYSFYPVYAKLFNIDYEEIAVNADFSLPIDHFFNSEGGVILPNPNAPTSLYIELSDIEAILLENSDQIVIIDEAYIDFATESATSLIDKYENLLVIQTTSKSRSLAGLRVGFALGNESLINGLIRIKDSFNSYTIDRLALAGAEAAFEDHDYFRKSTDKIIATREKVTRQMIELGFNVLSSQTNFVFVTHDSYHAEELYVKLRENGILVRHFDQEKTRNYLRITIGTAEDMERFIGDLKRIITTLNATEKI